MTGRPPTATGSSRGRPGRRPGTWPTCCAPRRSAALCCCSAPSSRWSDPRPRRSADGRRAELDEDITWSDLFGIALLAGVGFTVSLLIGDLAFGAGSTADERVKAAVLTGSVISAALAAAVLARRNAAYRRVAEKERLDADGDGVPDVYQRPGRD